MKTVKEIEAIINSNYAVEYILEDFRKEIPLKDYNKFVSYIFKIKELSYKEGLDKGNEITKEVYKIP